MASTATTPIRWYRSVPVILGALWLLAGAVAKLFWGTPADLPPLLKLLPLPLAFMYKSAISVELAVALLGFVAPRLAWAPQTVIFILFDVLLAHGVHTGQSSCGCFGAGIEIPPAHMMVVDSVILALILFSRPWRLPVRAWRPAYSVIAALLLVLPWVFVGSAREGAPAQEGGSLRRFAVLRPESWVGKPVRECDLGQWLDGGTALPDGRWVLYRDRCDDCAEYLIQMAAADDGGRPIVLIRIPERPAESGDVVVHVLPEGAHVVSTNLPAGVDFVVETPVEVEVESGRVTKAAEGARFSP